MSVFAHHTVSAATTPFCCCSMKAAQGPINKRAWLSSNKTLSTRTGGPAMSGWGWPWSLGGEREGKSVKETHPRLKCLSLEMQPHILNLTSKMDLTLLAEMQEGLGNRAFGWTLLFGNTSAPWAGTMHVGASLRGLCRMPSRCRPWCPEWTGSIPGPRLEVCLFAPSSLTFFKLFHISYSLADWR